MERLRNGDAVERGVLEHCIFGRHHLVMHTRMRSGLTYLFLADVSGLNNLKEVGKSHRSLTISAGAIPCSSEGRTVFSDPGVQGSRVQRTSRGVPSRVDGERVQAHLLGGDGLSVGPLRTLVLQERFTWSADPEEVFDREALQSGEAIALGARRVYVVVLEGTAVGEELLVGLPLTEGGNAQFGHPGRLECLLHARVRAEGA